MYLRRIFFSVRRASVFANLLNDKSRTRQFSIHFPHPARKMKASVACLVVRESCWIEPLCQLTSLQCAARSRCSLFPSRLLCRVRPIESDSELGDQVFSEKVRNNRST